MRSTSYGLSSNPVHIEMQENLTLTSLHQTTIMALELNYTVQATLDFTNMEIEEENRIDSDGDDSDGEDGEDGEDDEGSGAGFDPSDDDDDFNQEIDGDLNMADENMV
jgi:hypothetical protein